jgi:phosphatidylcholine synthase
MLARRFRVKETIPWFDGALLDNIVDYLTYVFAPIVLLWTTGSLPAGPLGWVVAGLPLLASSYQFCRVDAKLADDSGDDHFFLGFPSYWNVLAFYAIVLDASPAVVAVALVVFSVLVFVPIRYVYPSRMTTLRTTTLVLSAAWAVTYVVLLLQYPDPHPAVVAASLAYLVYYNALSIWFTLAGGRTRRSRERLEGAR